ncbi:MAG: hypothetical protein A2Y15_07220 [Clostridiales bacterium GWF2_36_10]|nr:MAG: hypothetical protein A2Y15_07220 [Clostridiales bacterium GWF2_36_10]HAN21324.1 hypothetical protein [Clostridiales bacterium]
MESIKELKEKLRTTRPVGWEQFPDIELYKDQVLSYMQRQALPSEGEEALTGAMINNYIKAGVLPRPNGKKYGKEHLAFLTAICALKPVMSVNNMEYLLGKQGGDVDAKSFYELLNEYIDKAMIDTANNLDNNLEENDLPEYILSIALQAAGLRIICESLLHIMRQSDNEKEKEKKTQNGTKKEKKENKDDKK